MGRNVNLSSEDSPKGSEVYQYSPLYGKDLKGKATHLVFRKKAGTDVWKTDSERDRVFSGIWATEQFNLSSKTVVEVKGLTPEGEYIYSYRKNDKLVHKTVHVDPERGVALPMPPEVDLGLEEEILIEKKPSLPLQPTFYKVQQLSLREFKQVQATNAIIAFLQSIVELLLTPFSYIYQLIAGRGEPRAFASMLAPVEHDRVGGIDHNAVLSQLSFMSRLFAKEDPGYHSKDLGLQASSERVITLTDRDYDTQNCPVKETETTYKILVGASKRVPNPDKGTTDYDYKYGNEVDNREEIWEEGESMWIRFEVDDPALASKYVAGHRTNEVKEYSHLEGREVHKYTEVKFQKGEWVELPKNSKIFEHNRPYDANHVIPKPEETHPRIFSGAQKMSHLFSEAYSIGTEMKEALQSGSKKKQNAILGKLVGKFEALPESEHLIIPIADGEGREYLPHFLIFVHIGGKTILKHIAFSSTSLDPGEMQVVTTYDLTDTLSNEVHRERFARSLMSMQPYSRSKDSKEVDLKGPMVRDFSLDSLFLEYGKVVPGANGPVMKKSSRDPVKAIFTVMKELGIEENSHLSLEHATLGRITESKAHFYKVYVDHLVSYYEENEHKLTASERARCLDGILWYAEKVRHYMEKEVGVDTALAITENLIEFVESKLEEFKRTEALENKDVKNLLNKVSLFRADLSEDITETVGRVETVKEVEGSRVDIQDSAMLNYLRNYFDKTDLPRSAEGTDPSRVRMYRVFTNVIRRADVYLSEGNTLGAKTLLLGLMQTLPPGRALDEFGEECESFWDRMDESELTAWTSALDILSERMFEAALRSGQYPLMPHEVFEFNVTVPLLQRYLFQRKIPMKIEEFEIQLGAYREIENIETRLENKRQAFIQLREGEIEKEVTDRLKEEWKREDEEDKLKLLRYNVEKKQYDKELKEYNFYQEKENATWQEQRDHPRPYYEPRKPTIDSVEVKKQKREIQLRNEIDEAKDRDHFLNELKDLELDKLDENWDNLTHRGSDRLQAVMGSFARMIGISKELYAYKHGGLGWIENSYFSDTSTDIWLMKKDCSLMLGSSPWIEKRYKANKLTLESLTGSGRLDTERTSNFIIGYDGLGDGTRVTEEDARTLTKEIENAFGGFFNSGEGSRRLAPDEITHLRRVNEMRKILREPVKYLAPYSEGMFGMLRNLFMSDSLTPESLKKKFSSMSAIHLVAAEGVFTLSTSETSKGSLATNDREETPATHLERKQFLGQISPEMAVEKVGGDRERNKIDEVHRDPLYRGLDPVQEFILRESALAKASSCHRGSSEEKLSYLAVSQCLHFIYQYPEKLELPQVRHTLYKTILQQGKIEKHVKNNPEFFIRFGSVLKEVCSFLQTKGVAHRASEVFIREMSERIRLHAIEIYGGEEDSMGDRISKALPAYDHETVVGLFLSQISSKEQKLYATYALSYYCRNVPKVSLDTIDDWRTILNAFFIMQKSPFEIGHSGMQAEIMHLMQKDLLFRIGTVLKSNKPGSIAIRNKLLGELTGHVGNWQVNPSQSFTYTLTTIEEGEEVTHGVDIRTGKGFKAQIELGERSRLPEQIRNDENFRFLFGSMDPLVMSEPAEDGIIDYRWADEKGGVEFLFRYDSSDHSLQMYQICDGKKYQFQRLKLSDSIFTKVWQLFARHNNRTIEDLIKKKGVWIPVDKNDRQDTSKVLIAQHGWSLEKDPIALTIRRNKVTGATVGKGKERKYVCSGLSSKSSELLSFRSGNGLLLLSKDRSHVDEIRFPVDPVTKEQLILKKSESDSKAWVVSGREDWEWQLTNTKTYEKRFGKNWRDYILPLKNRRTGEEEIWIFPHMAVSGEKRGSKVKFLKSAVDFIDVIGGSISEMGVAEGTDIGELRAMVGAAENFMGGTDGLIEGAEGLEGLAEEHGAGDMQSQLVGLLKGLFSPRAMCYKIGRRQESSSHAGFFYLAHVASLQGDWGAASRYLSLLSESGSSTSEDLTQLKNMVMVLFGKDFLLGGGKDLIAPKTPLEAAFRAKLAAALVTLNTRLRAEHKEELFSEEGEMNMKEMLMAGGALFYLEYRKGLTTHYQQLKDHGLLLTEREESILTSDLKMLGVASGIKSKAPEVMEEKPTPKAKPIRFDIPSVEEMTELSEAIADHVQPYGVWSIHNMHTKKGSYPKWDTVLSNFWSYWEWIDQNDLAIEDIAFLLREVPPSKKVEESDALSPSEKIDIARRALLTFWHYSKKRNFEEHRLHNDVAEDALLREVLRRRVDMPDFASMEGRKDRWKKESQMNPSVWRGLRSKGYDKYVELRHWMNEITYKEKKGGIEHVRGAKKDFVTIQNNLFNDFISKAVGPLKERRLEIHPSDFEHAPLRAYEAPEEHKPVDRLGELKERAWRDISTTLVNSLSMVHPTIKRDLHNNKGKIKPVLDGFLDLPNFDRAWDQVEGMLPEILGQLGVMGIPPEMISMVSSLLKPGIAEVHKKYAKAVGFPECPYPRGVEKAAYEAVEVRQPSETVDWVGKYFVKANTEKLWDERKEIAKAKFNPETAKTEREKFKLEKICAGIDEAAEEMKKKTSSAFNVTALNVAYKEITACIKELSSKHVTLRGRVLDSAREHAEELGIMHLFADRGRITDEQIMQKVFDLYRYGQLGRLEDLGLQEDFAEMVTEYILVTTEMQQYEKARGTCKELARVWQSIQKRIPSAYTGETRARIAQKLAVESIDWMLHSSDLKNFLTESSKRLTESRYAEEGKNGKLYLIDQKFTRRYLVSDVRNGWISREKATTALENMLKDLRVTEKSGKPVRFIKAKMGTGKSDFIFPEAIDLLIQEGYEPIMITTDELITQLQISMGDKAFVFKFSINFGLHEKAEGEEIDRHLSTLIETLENLKAEKKAVLTAPSQIAALRDKRVQLQDMISMMDPGPERSELFGRLQKVKTIEAYFKKPDSMYLVDEDVNYDISFEYNYATGEYRTIDPIRFDMAEKIMHVIMNKHPALWNKIVDNNLRAVTDVEEEFSPVVRSLYNDTEFWKSVGWDEETWTSIPEEEFVQFILGKREELPTNMEAWNPKEKDEKQTHKAHVAALKTFISKTLDSVRGVNPKLERGIASTDGVTVAPRSDGEEKSGVLYGEESENALHHMFHYAGKGNMIGEKIFLEKKKDLAGLGTPISPHYPEETWKGWASEIGKIYSRGNYKTEHEAFINAPELALQRIQFLRHLMLDTSFIRVYLEQITFNSQDIGIGLGDRIRVGSGTGEPTALNLSDYLEDTGPVPDVVLGETLLCVDLKGETTTFAGTPLEHIQKRAKDPRCHVVLNYDYEVEGNDTEKVAGLLRRTTSRQMIYRDRENNKKIWNSGERFFPMAYEPESIGEDPFFMYFRKDARGVHFHIPRGGGKYGDAMVGTGNEEDAIAQLLWRMRHLDGGHTVRFSHDEKTAKQIRLANGLGEKDPITMGDAMRYFTLNTMGEEDVKNVKAAIFKAATPLKTHLDEVVRRPYDLTGIEETECIEELEGKAIFKTMRSLYILSSRINWIREYQPHTTTDPINFMLKLYKDELVKLGVIRESCMEELYKVVGESKDARLVYEKNLLTGWAYPQINSKEPLSLEDFDKRLTLFLNNFAKDYLPQEIGVAREILRRYYEIQIGFINAEKEIIVELERIKNDEEYQKFLNNNLPKEVSIDLDEGARSEQKIQQLQEQQKEEKVQQVERVMRPVLGDKPTKPIVFSFFKDLALGKARIEKSYSSSSWYGSSKYEWRDNGNILPLATAMKEGEGGFRADLPKGEYRDTYISQRAFRMLYKMGISGAPSLELLVIEHEGVFHSVIITPAEREETVAPALIIERNNREGLSPVLSKKSKKASYTKEHAWTEAKSVLVNMAKGYEMFVSGASTMVQENMDNKRSQVEPFITTFLNETDFESAWDELLTKDVPKILKLLGLGDYASYLLGSIKGLKPKFKEIHTKYNKALAPVSKPKLKMKAYKEDTDHIAVYALSNENFSRMVMDCVETPEEKNPDFIFKMVMNKIFLNWTQFTLPEIDLLTSYITNLHSREFSSLIDSLKNAHAKDVVKILESIRKGKADQEWLLSVAKRKLEANYPKKAYSKHELGALEGWIADKLQGVHFSMKVRHLESISADNSVSLLKELKESKEEDISFI